MSSGYQRASRGPVTGRPAGNVVVISGTGGGQGQAGEHELHGPLPDRCRASSRAIQAAAD